VDPRRALSFGAAADVYAIARPTYPVDAVRYVLPVDAQRVLDLGAGTGKLTSVLLDLGLDVVAVEPDEAMRAHIDPRADVLAGTAEDVPLDDASVDAVVVGQAWHWFSVVAAVASVQRVLRPGGTLGLLWNVIDDTSGWQRDLAELVGMEDRLSLVPPGETRPYEESDGFSPWAHQLFPHTQAADADLVVANMASRSIVIVQEQRSRLELLGRVRAAVPDGSFDLGWVTDAWRAGKPS
jgi:SAM-dependent methyltransferase